MRDVYFVRHAESDITVQDDFLRPLTPKGKRDSALVTNYLKNKEVKHIFSSPYVRAVDTVSHLANELNIPIKSIDDFKERYITDKWIDNFGSFSQKQWHDFDYKFSDGESLNDVQKRNIEALKDLLGNYPTGNIVVGSHGTALCTLLNYFYPSYGFADFNRMKGIMPWIVKLTFEGNRLLKTEAIDVINNNEVESIR